MPTYIEDAQGNRIKVSGGSGGGGGGGTGGGVESFNGRKGVVTSQAGDYTAAMVGALPNTTQIPSKTSDLTNDSGFMTSFTETDPTVPDWAKQPTKPTYTAAEVGALPNTTTVPTKVSDLTNDSQFTSKAYVDQTVADGVQDAKDYTDTKTAGFASTTDLTNLDTRVGSIETKVGNDSVAKQIADSIDALDLENTYDEKGASESALEAAKSYADEKDTSISAAQQTANTAASTASQAASDVANLVEYIGEIPEGSEATDIIGYIDEKTSGIHYDDTALKARVTATENAITVLNGDATVTGSVDQKVVDGIARVVAEAPEALDNLKKIADWIANNTDDAAAMNSAILKNSADIAELNALIGELPEGAAAQTVIDYITEAINGSASASELANAIQRLTTLEGQYNDTKEEIEGIRVGFDGTNYASAGDAVRAAQEAAGNIQEQLEADFAELQSSVPNGLIYENNMLQLMRNGEGIGNQVEITGGGGGGTSLQYTIALTNNLESRVINAVQSALVQLSFDYSSQDEQSNNDGAGTGSLTINGLVVSAFSAQQGTNLLEISSYLIAGENTVSVKVTNSEGSSRSLSYTVKVTVLSITTSFAKFVECSGDTTFYYTATGNGPKTVYFLLDGVQIGSTVITTSGRSSSFVIPAQASGGHIFRVYCTMEIDGETVQSNVITIGLLYTTSAVQPIVVCTFDQTEAVQGEVLALDYSVYSPDAELAPVQLSVIDSNEEVVFSQSISVNRTPQVWTVQDYPAGNIVLRIQSGSVYQDMPLSVTEYDLGIYEVTDSLELNFNPYGRSNGEENPASWVSGNISATFSGMSFTDADGWLVDENSAPILRILPGGEVNIPFEMFATDARSTGKTIEVEMATHNVMDYDTVVMSCMSGGRGLLIASQSASLTSEQSEISMQFKEDEKVRLSFVVEPTGVKRLVYVYVDAIMCGCIQYPALDDFSQTSPVGLTIGANTSGIDIYRIRSYGKNLTPREVLDNFIVDRPFLSDRIALKDSNDVTDDNDLVAMSKLPETLPYMVISCEELPQYKGDKKNCDIQYVNRADPARSFTANGAQIDVQGTSSAGYKRKNFKIKFSNGITYTSSGEQASKYKLRIDSIPVSTFCMKADVASSEGANNVELVRLYNDSIPYKTPPQVENPKVRVGIDGLPCVIFWRNTNTNETLFQGKYNLNNDKGTEATYGLTEGCESWEIRNNTSPRVLFQESEYDKVDKDDPTKKDWLNDFEGRYPDGNTDPTNLKIMTDWVVSTDREAATGQPLEAHNIEGVMPYSKAWRTVAYGNGVFVAICGDFDSEIKGAYSRDGITWYECVFPFSSVTRDIAYGNGVFVAVAESCEIARSTDGITWTKITPHPYEGVSTSLIGIAYGNGKFVIISTRANVFLYSADGLTWNASNTVPNATAFRSICFGDGKFVAVQNNNNNGAFSLDGISWSAFHIPSGNDMSSIVYGNGVFVAIDDDKLAYSNDAVSWEEITVDYEGSSSSFFRKIVFGNGMFVIFIAPLSTVDNSGGLLYSTDGINWSFNNSFAGMYIQAACYDGNKFLAIPAYTARSFYGDLIGIANYNGEFYSTDTPEYRLAKFKAEFEQHFVKTPMLFYYLWTEVFLMVDSRAKNFFPSTFDGVHWQPLPYDADTALGINNEGQLVFPYDLEDYDTFNGANVFNGQDSVLWQNVRDAFPDDLRNLYNTLRSGSLFNYPTIIQRFNQHQETWPEAIWNQDAYEKYLEPLYADNDGSYLAMLQGNKRSQREWWLYNGMRYRDSKYRCGDATGQYITLRCYNVGDITVTPYSHIWPSIKYGSYTVSERGERNVPTTLECPLSQMNDTEVYIYSADRLSEVSDLSGLQVGYANFSMATKLQRLKLGADGSYTNTRLTELYVGNNELLSYVNVQNCVNLAMAPDFSKCVNIEEVRAAGSSIAGLSLPVGGKLKVLELPGTLANLTVQEQKQFELLDMPSYDNLTTLRIENTPNIPVSDIVNDAPNLNRVRLIGAEWTCEEDELAETIEKLKSCIGMDAAGNNVQNAVLTGTVHVLPNSPKIYGVEWAGTEDTSMVRTDRAAEFENLVPYVAGMQEGEYSSPFDKCMPWRGMQIVEDDNAGTLVAIPKFWYKLSTNGNRLKIQIADKEVEGFYVSPAHADRGDGRGERDVVYVGRYHCNLYCKSVSGELPWTNTTRYNARVTIHTVGDDLWQSDYAMRLTIQLLYLVEFANWDSQKCIGYGCGDNTAVAAVGYTDSMPYHTGTMQSSRTQYGFGTQYRHIEGLWDNVYDWMDGCYYNTNGMSIILNPSQFSDTANGTLIGMPVGGWIKKMGISEKLGVQWLYPTEAGGNQSSYVPDYWGFNASSPCLYVGGNSGQSLNRGLFYVGYTGVSSAGGDVGCRLMKLP